MQESLFFCFYFAYIKSKIIEVKSVNYKVHSSSLIKLHKNYRKLQYIETNNFFTIFYRFLVVFLKTKQNFNKV